MNIIFFLLCKSEAIFKLLVTANFHFAFYSWKRLFMMNLALNLLIFFVENQESNLLKRINWHRRRSSMVDWIKAILLPFYDRETGTETELKRKRNYIFLETDGPPMLLTSIGWPRHHFLFSIWKFNLRQAKHVDTNPEPSWENNVENPIFVYKHKVAGSHLKLEPKNTSNAPASIQRNTNTLTQCVQTTLDWIFNWKSGECPVHIV